MRVSTPADIYFELAREVITMSINFVEAFSAVDDQTVLAEVSRDIGSNEDLFDLFLTELRLPEYFGYNWDALEECLNDFSWIDEPRVLIRHLSVPALGEDGTRIYLNILYRADQNWRLDETRQFDVEFLVSDRAAVESIRTI